MKSLKCIVAALLLLLFTSAQVVTATTHLSVVPRGALVIQALTLSTCTAKAPFAYRIGMTFGGGDNSGTTAALLCMSREIRTADDFHVLDETIKLSHAKWTVIMGINRLPGNDYNAH